MLEWTNHGFDIGMWHGIKLMELELIIWADVDVSSLVLGAVTVLRCREDYKVISSGIN